MIAELVRGEPNYELQSPEMAQATRAQLPRLQETLRSMGELQTVTFMEVGPQGGDGFDLQFSNGALNVVIALDADGKTVMAGMRPGMPR